MELHTKFIFGTKSETLEQLKPQVKRSTILDLYYFSVENWLSSSEGLVQEIQEKFSRYPSLIVRSSAACEDTKSQSMAGAFLSCLDIQTQNADQIHSAIAQVIGSYTSRNTKDQVLIQPMLNQVAVSGVITTHLMTNGAPYYVINYDDESGKTDSVTGGVGVSKMVLIFRDTDLAMIDSERVKKWIEFTREIESICGHVPLDLEFAQTKNGQIYLVQVRILSTEKTWATLNKTVHASLLEAKKSFAQISQKKVTVLGDSTILGQMPDWNPAEIIGTCPRPLAISLYKKIITDRVWREARAKMGYRPIQSEKLMVILGSHPYIDVRNSFNSLLPAGLNDGVAEKLVNAGLYRLGKHPELHDKVEFQIAFSILTFDFDIEFQRRYPGLLTESELQHFKQRLKTLTQACVCPSDTGSLFEALQNIETLKSKQLMPLASRWNNLKELEVAENLLSECIELGSRPFAIVARHAFIAESLLQSAVSKKILSLEKLNEIKRSWNTITTSLSKDLKKLSNIELTEQAFLQKYGHLRPGTYDILSLRYDQRKDFFSGSSSLGLSTSAELHEVELSPNECVLLQSELDTLELNISTKTFLEYAKASIIGREYSKFIFSKNLSDAIECIAKWGESLNLSRDLLSHLPLEDILNIQALPISNGEKQNHVKTLVEQSLEFENQLSHLRLGYLIRGYKDLDVVPVHRSAPNFITNSRIERPVLFLNAQSEMKTDLQDKIVCIENADPGFDWIFTRKIAGLITKFGGANSHMAIRCTEYGLPAAIGCGELTFDQLLEVPYVELNCRDRIVRPVYG